MENQHNNSTLLLFFSPRKRSFWYMYKDRHASYLYLVGLPICHSLHILFSTHTYILLFCNDLTQWVFHLSKEQASGTVSICNSLSKARYTYFLGILSLIKIYLTTHQRCGSFKKKEHFVIHFSTLKNRKKWVVEIYQRGQILQKNKTYALRAGRFLL